MKHKPVNLCEASSAVSGMWETNIWNAFKYISCVQLNLGSIEFDKVKQTFLPSETLKTSIILMCIVSLWKRDWL